MVLTTKAMLQAVYGCRYRGFKGVLYLFPGKSDVTDFSRGRVSPLIDENEGTIGKWLKDTDSANIKRIWNAFLYLRGMRSRVGLKSIPVDYVIFDELDEGHQGAIDMAMERMGHSEHKRVLMLVQPHPAGLRHRQSLPGDRPTVLAAEMPLLRGVDLPGGYLPGLPAGG